MSKLPEPVSDLIAVWAIAEPAPKAIPLISMPPIPENIPPDDWAGAGAVGAGAGAGAYLAGAGLWAVAELLLGVGELLPPDAINNTNKIVINIKFRLDMLANYIF